MEEMKEIRIRFEGNQFTFHNGKSLETFTGRNLLDRIASQGRGKFGEHPERITDHTNRVAESCGRIGREYGLDLSKVERLNCAAYAHDIAKSLDDKKRRQSHEQPENVCKAISHALTDDSDLRATLEKDLENSSSFADVLKIIKSHNGDLFEPEPSLREESIILRMADKIDKLDKALEKTVRKTEEKLKKNPKKNFKTVFSSLYKEEIAEAEKSCQKNLKLLQKSLKDSGESGKRLLECIQREYEHIRQSVECEKARIEGEHS